MTRYMITLSEQTKKILFGAFFVVFTVGTGYALYYFFFRPVPPETVIAVDEPGYGGALGQAGDRGPITPGTTDGTGTLPSAGDVPGTVTTGQTDVAAASGDVTLLRDSVTQATSESADGGTRFYNPEDGRFYKLNPDGTVTALSGRQFFNVQTVNWGKSEDDAVLEFPDGSNIYYDFTGQRQTTLPQHWEDFDFAPTESKVVAKSMGLDENNRFLITSDADGNEVTALYHLGANGDLVTPSWSPNEQVVGFSKTGGPQPDNGEEIVVLGKNHEEFKSLKVAGRGFQPNWSPSGKQLLYSVYHERDENKPMLWVSDASGSDIGNNRKRLNLLTWANKCVWADDKKIYCAVPISLPLGAGFDQASFNNIPDDIYVIDMTSGVAKKISTPDQNHPVSQPILSKDQSKLIFTDGMTGKLYSYTLKP